MKGLAEWFSRWLATLPQVAFSNFTDQALWVLTGVTVLAVWVVAIFTGYTERLNATTPFLTIWLGFLTGGSLITGARDAHKRGTDIDYQKAKNESGPTANIENAGTVEMVKEAPSASVRT
jgi:hypothetical protein